MTKDPLRLTRCRQSARQKNMQLNRVEDNKVAIDANEASPLEEKSKPVERMGSAMLILRSHPTTEEWNNTVAGTKNGIALTGTIAERLPGPVLGLVDIGTCDDAYLFRMSLPGVSREAGDFSCEIEKNGKVLVTGSTVTGQKKVYKYLRTFEMQTQHLPPPGRFSISFELPGPVDPRSFTATFGNDGIFEAVLLRRDIEDQKKDQVEVDEIQGTDVDPLLVEGQEIQTTEVDPYLFSEI